MTAGRMTYDLRRLRLHQIIQRIPHTNRYQVTPFGLQIAIFFSRTYSRLLTDRPGGDLRPDTNQHPATPTTSTDSTKRSPPTSTNSTSPPET